MLELGRTASVSAAGSVTPASSVVDRFPMASQNLSVSTSRRRARRWPRCRPSSPAAATRRGRPRLPPPTAVQTLTLKAAPVEDASEFIATVRSLRSTTVQPDVDGIVTRILVVSGQRVNVGTPLAQINPERQEAAVSSTEANRSGLEADVAVLAAAGEAPRVAARIRRGQQGRVRPGGVDAADGRVAADGAQRPGAAGPRRAAVLSRHARRRRASSATFQCARATGSRPRR